MAMHSLQYNAAELMDIRVRNHIVLANPVFEHNVQAPCITAAGRWPYRTGHASKHGIVLDGHQMFQTGHRLRFIAG